MNSPYKILLAENDGIPRTVIKNRLEEEGFEVLLATSPDELIAQGSQADVLVVDARLWHWDKGLEQSDQTPAKGLEAVATLVAENRLASNVLIIFYSIAARDSAIFRHGLEVLDQKQRPYEFLTRPFEMAILVEKIKGGLGRRRN